VKGGTLFALRNAITGPDVAWYSY